MKCTFCGADVEDDALFCTACGNKFDDEVASDVKEPEETDSDDDMTLSFEADNENEIADDEAGENSDDKTADEDADVIYADETEADSTDEAEDNGAYDDFAGNETETVSYDELIDNDEAASEFDDDTAEKDAEDVSGDDAADEEAQDISDGETAGTENEDTPDNQSVDAPAAAVASGANARLSLAIVMLSAALLAICGFLFIDKLLSLTPSDARASTIRIVSQSQDVTVKPGTATEFFVDAEGTNLTYQWYVKKSGEQLWHLWKGHDNYKTNSKANESWDGMQVYCMIVDNNRTSVASEIITISIEK